MRRILTIFILAVVTMLSGASAIAREYGAYPERAPFKMTVTDGKKLNVRTKPSTKGRLVTQLRPGDVVYVADTTFYEGSGYNWIRISDRWGRNIVSDGYVTNLDRFNVESNPNYVAPTQEQVELEDAVKSSQTVAKWILLILSILAAILYLAAYFSENGSEKILGEYDNGMRRTFFFNIAPYRTVIYITLMLIAAALTSVVLMLLVGGVGFVLLWIVKILCYILVWIGIIACVGGAIACICGVWACIVLVALGGVIWYYDDSISGFGDRCAETGLNFFHEFNMLGYSADLFMEYWKPALIIVCIHLALFLCFAVIWMLVAGLLIAYEKFVTARYNIKHPCPHCHQPSEPATYLSKGDSGYEALPNGIRLRPGVYGLFHITHPNTGERMPTMLLNGRDQLVRQCANCERLIQAEEGTELHMAVAGSAMSGKSTLTYRLVAELFKRAGDDNVEFTDVDNTITDLSVISKVKSIAGKGKIEEEDLPQKTSTDDLASMQLIVKRQHSSIPYRLFINDVGGEHFDPTNSANSVMATRYFRNVDSLLVVIDPLTTEFDSDMVSEEFTEWLEKNDKDKVNKIPLRHIMDVIDIQLKQYHSDPKRIHLNVVLTKKDLGYIPQYVNITSQEELKRYLQKDLGLGPFLHWGQNFASCNIFVVSAMASGYESNIKPLFEAVIEKQLEIKL